MPYSSNNLIGQAGYIGRPKVAVFRYDFAVDGGVVGPITLRGEYPLPVGAIVTDSLLIVDTLVTGGAGATVSLDLQTAADLKAAATLATAPALDTAGAKRLTAMDADTAVITVASTAKSVVATVAVNALTAGKFRVLVTYLETVA